MSLEMFIQHFFNALTLGALYGLIAIGYSMVYGILRLINFAHGDIFMIGAYFVFFGTISPDMPFTEFLLGLGVQRWALSFVLALLPTILSFWVMNRKVALIFSVGIWLCYAYTRFFPMSWILAVAIAIGATTICGIVVDRVAYRPLRDAPRISALISAIGISFLMENLCLVLFRGLPRPVYQPEWLMDPIIVGKVRILPLSLVIVAMTAALVLGLLWVVHRTKPGLAMRAISKDIETTRLMGVSVDKIIALTFGLGSALAAAAGIMWALRFPQVHPFMGIMPGLKAFIAAVVGGIGSVRGAVVGGLLIGFIEIMTVAFFPDLSGYRDAFAFVLLIVILLLKPTGLMGEKLEDKI